ncbi:MAG: inositol monophosphatase family protein [Alphaproteobacteria bacterium]
MDLLIKGSTELNKMFAALDKTAVGLRHDFGEVENLQQSLRGARDFVARAAARIEESILSDLQLVRPMAGLLTPNVTRVGDSRDEFVLAMSGAANFVRANPNFAISLALRSNGETKIALVYAPMLDKLYYAESGGGAYVFSAFHSVKIRVSQISDPADLMVAYNTDDNSKKIGDVRVSGCPALDLCGVASGKLDAFVSRPLDFAEIAAGDLILREAGGKITSDVEIIATNGHVEL